MKAHVFTAVALIGVALVAEPFASRATAEPQLAQRSNMRFRAMDANGDGRITRAEWRGSERSFRNHDWNNDGILSGDEVRAGALQPRGRDDGFYEWTRAGFRSLDVNGDSRIARSEWDYDYELFRRADRNRDNVLTLTEFLGGESTDLDREDRFADLDTNNNGSIERREWHGTATVFDWLDRNNDNRLSRAETVESDLPEATGTSGRNIVENQVVRVSAQTRWTDTGIVVRAGDVLNIRANGQVTMSNASDIADPAGSRSGRVAPDAPLRQHLAGALIGRIGDSSVPFFIGNSETIRVQNSGRLSLSVNDDYLGDNTGEFRVTISVRR